MKCSSFYFFINALHEINWVWNCEVLPKVTQRLVWRRMRTQGELKVEKSENQWGLRNLWAHLLCCVPWPLFSNLEWDHSNWVMDFTAGIPKFHSPTKKKKKKTNTECYRRKRYLLGRVYLQGKEQHYKWKTFLLNL